VLKQWQLVLVYVLCSFIRLFSTKWKGKISKDGLRRLVWMVVCWLDLMLIGKCWKQSRALVSLSWWRLWYAWIGSGIECWCSEAMLIVLVDMVFLLIVYRSLVCWITSSVRLVEEQSSVDRHEQFGSSYWSGTTAVTNSPDLLQGSSPTCHNDHTGQH
jgi:hypothetical protein